MSRQILLLLSALTDLKASKAVLHIPAPYTFPPKCNCTDRRAQVKYQRNHQATYRSLKYKKVPFFFFGMQLKFGRTCYIVIVNNLIRTSVQKSMLMIAKASANQ